MTAQLQSINCFPVKSMGGEALKSVSLTVGAPLPGDREWAVMHESALSHLDDGDLQKWLPKSAFLRGAAAPMLQAVRGGWQGDKLCLTHPATTPLIFDPRTEGEKLLDWVTSFWPTDKPAPARLVRGPQALTDSRLPYISILSLDSLDALSQAGGHSFGTDRWRGNLWVRGWDAWAERDLIGKDLQLGQARLRLVQPITRCSATCVDTTTGKVDTDMLALLNTINGDRCFGVYAEVTQGGDIALNDEVMQ